MSGRVFFDTNILVYATGSLVDEKSIIARDLLRLGANLQNGVISYQVVQEFLNVAMRKFRTQVTADLASEYLHEIVGGLEVLPWSMELMESGLSLTATYKFNWYDSLIVAAAMQSGCSTLYTEDLQSGQIMGNLTVVNPFKQTLQ